MMTTGSKTSGAPRKGDRIEFEEKPGKYYLVTEKPEASKDAAGREFWTTRALDPSGREKYMCSDDVQSWRHFRGDNYPWHDEMIERRREEAERKRREDMIRRFETENSFPDGRPLRTHPYRPLALKVTGNAINGLAMLVGETINVTSIDYPSRTVDLELVNPELALNQELMESLRGVAATDLMKSAEPVMNPKIAREKVRIPVKDADGNDTEERRTITIEELLQLTPGLNALASTGQVELYANVYLNYQRGDVFGEEVFLQMLLDRGADPETTEYYRNSVERKELPEGGFSPRYAWTGEVIINPPIPDEAIEEVKKIALNSRVNERRDGTVQVYSNSLYKNMILLGATYA